MVHRFITIWNKTNLIKRISIAIGIGVLLAVIFPQAQAIGLLGQIFVGGLKAIAPLLVFALVANALSQQQKGQKSNMKTVILLYLLGTFAAALVAVLVNFFFPISIELASSSQKVSPPDGIGQVLSNLLLQLVDNPVNALITANYIGILSWAVIFGIAMREASHHSKELLQTLADITSKIVEWIINLAPLGILGLVYTTISGKGFQALKSYGVLLLALIASMLIVALIINPLISFIMLRKNPYPLVWRCLRVSGVTAFFTRSSAANIPVNMKLCRDLGLNPETYSVSIPLGATINMAGAAITINPLTLAAVNTLGFYRDLVQIKKELKYNPKTEKYEASAENIKKLRKDMIRLSEKYGAQLNLYLFLEGDVPEGASLSDYIDFTSLPKNVYVVVWGENGKLDSNGFQAE